MPDVLKKTEEIEPHYMGHRDRLRERFIGAPDGLPDYELLELLLFMMIPRRDVKPIAKDLIAQFGNLNGVLRATPEQLSSVVGISDITATSIKSIHAAGLRMMKQDIMNKPVLNSWAKLLDYLNATMAHETREQFRLLFLNKKNELIADEIQQTGTVDHTQAYPREIVKRALELSASAIILVHNHPSGDATPSTDDIHMTRDIIAAVKALHIAVHDHLIVSKQGITSFKSLGLL